MNDNMLKAVAGTGYFARGLVYLAIAAFAIGGLVGAGNSDGARGALAQLAAKPFGQSLLWVIAVGLIAFMVWRLIQSIGDADHHGSDVKGLAVRAMLLISAVSHGLLALTAIYLVTSLGDANTGNPSGTQQGTSWLLSQPFGRWLLGAIGVGIVLWGVAHAFKGIGGRYRKRLKSGLPDQLWVRAVCALGLVARGLVFVLIGGFLVRAARYVDSNEAKGLGGVLRALEASSYGPWLLGGMAMGLGAFGLYCLIESRWRHVSPPTFG